MLFIRYSSLEVVLGAVLYQYFLYDVYFQRFPPISEGLILAFSVWFIYLIDRQIDNVFQTPHDDRHHFHQENKSKLQWLIGVVGMAILVLLPFQSGEVLQAGFALSFLVSAYGFTWHKGWLRREKELFTAILYGLGVGLLCWVQEPRSLLLVFSLAALAYQNLCFFALLEKQNAFHSSRLRMMEWILLGLLSGIYASTQDLFIVLPFLVTFGVTFILSRLSFSEDKRLWADLAFWSPLFYLLHGIFST
jgi:hypothetical protein